MEECYAVSAFWKQSMLFVKSVIDFLTEFILGALIMMRPKLTWDTPDLLIFSNSLNLPQIT